MYIYIIKILVLFGWVRESRDILVGFWGLNRSLLGEEVDKGNSLCNVIEFWKGCVCLGNGKKFRKVRI